MRETHSTNTNAFLRSDEGKMGIAMRLVLRGLVALILVIATCFGIAEIAPTVLPVGASYVVSMFGGMLAGVAGMLWVLRGTPF